MPNLSPHSSFTRPRLEAGSLPEKSVSGNGLRLIQAAECARSRLWPDSRPDRPVAAGIQGKFAFPRPHPSVEPNRRLLPARHGLPRNPDLNAQIQKSHSPPVLPPRGFQRNAYDDKKRAGCCVSRSSALESAVSPLRAGFSAALPLPCKALTSRLLHPYLPWSLLKLYRLPPWARRTMARPAQRNAGTGTKRMREIGAGILLLIPAGLAVAFMLFVLWKFWTDDKR